MRIRNFAPEDADELRAVFLSSVHGLASEFYTQEQIDAWGSQTYDRQAWLDRLTANKPFVATIDGQIAGFADLQSSGYIDLLFVAAFLRGRVSVRA